MDVFNNTVDVVTGTTASPLQQSLDNQFGPGVIKVLTSPATPKQASYSNGSAPPAYGGQHISSPFGYYQGEVECTSGFTVTTQTTYQAIVTAGHCPLANPGGTWYVGYNSDQCLPVVCSQFQLNVDSSSNSYRSGSNGDFDIMYANCCSSDFNNWVYYSTSQVLTVTSVGAAGSTTTDVPGAEVCNSDGHSNLYTCGSVVSTNATVSYPQDGSIPPATFYNMRLSTTYDAPGDSGSPVISTGYNVTAVGVVSGEELNSSGGFQYCIYSHISYLYEANSSYSVSTN